MNLQKLRKTVHGREGVTLVELLVVMLIVVILAVALVPFFGDYVVKARYTAEAVPATGDLCTKIQLYKFETGYLPGLAMAGENPAVSAAYPNGSTCIDGDASGIQTFYAATNDLTIARVYKPAVGITPTSATTSLDHFSMDIAIDQQHLTGANCKPSDFQYLSMRGGYQSASYFYAVGCFGSGSLPAGTGYAVLEVNNAACTDTAGGGGTTVGKKFVATFERWRPIGDASPKLYFSYNVGSATDKTICYIPNAENLLSSDPAVVKIAMDSLVSNGWTIK